MTKLYTYIMTVDSGLAPNPFGGWCTLAVCTPNHQPIAANKGDWIAGFSSKQSGHKFIYIMRITEIIHMNDYFRDERFDFKKPNMQGNWQQQCGDNMYYQDENHRWIQLDNPFHKDLKDQDTKKPLVYVSNDFCYLGKDRVSILDEFKYLVGGRGCRVNHPELLQEKFLDWVSCNFEFGQQGLPLNADFDTCKPCKNPSNLHQKNSCNT
ncbi:Nmad2 family putative nucleotide modification protein [Pseudoalteromonas piscicida]